jgi:hypothetical protein
VARKLLLLLLLILVPGGILMVGAALLASSVGKRFPQISQRLRHFSWRGRRPAADPLALTSATIS